RGTGLRPRSGGYPMRQLGRRGGSRRTGERHRALVQALVLQARAKLPHGTERSLRVRAAQRLFPPPYAKLFLGDGRNHFLRQSSRIQMATWMGAAAPDRTIEVYGNGNHPAAQGTAS